MLAAFDLKSGKILWQRWIDSDVMSAPVAVDRELYVTSFGGTVYKFNRMTARWCQRSRARATGAPVVLGKNVYLTKRADDGKNGRVEEAITAQLCAREPRVMNRVGKMAPYLNGKIQSGTVQKAAGNQLDTGNGFGGGAPAAANALAAFSNIGHDNVSTMQAFQGSRMLPIGSRNFNCMGDEVICGQGSGHGQRRVENQIVRRSEKGRRRSTPHRLQPAANCLLYC